MAPQRHDNRTRGTRAFVDVAYVLADIYVGLVVIRTVSPAADRRSRRDTLFETTT